MRRIYNNLIMKKVIFFTAIFISIQLNAQYVFEENVIIDDTGGTSGATDVQAVDIDGDGDLDILSSSYWDDKIAWYENTDGEGNFSSQHIINDDINGATSVYAADLDGDGDNDVVCTSGIDGYVTWFENMSNGTFGPRKFIQCGTYGCTNPEDIDVIDLDGDGDNDILMTYANSIQAWFENTDGQGDFSEKRRIGEDNFDHKKTISGFDLDLDGDIDVLISAYGGIIWYENLNGQGNFPSQPEFISLTVSGGSSADAVDLDSDGDLDVLSSSTYDHKIAWYENFNGLFGPQQIINSAAINASSVSHADLDNDGDFDVISASSGDNQIVWYENIDGLGGFGAPQIISSETLGENIVYMGDLDSDNDTDIISASFEDDKIAWYENTTGLGDFSAQMNISALESVNHPLDVFYGDIDQDGDLDVLSASEFDNKIAWFENLDGQGNFSPPHIITTNAFGANLVYASDLDGDGDLDVLSGASDNYEISWYENTDGNGNFGSGIPVANFDFLDSISTSDFDGDGDQDILVSTFYLPTTVTAWIENTDGQGNFNTPNILPNSNNEHSAIAMDFDVDGDYDIISLHVPSVIIRKNIDGLGNFIEFITIPTIPTARYIISSDIDGDGDLDLVVSGDSLIWYVNLDGLGTFSQMQYLPNGGGLNCEKDFVRTMDIDGDGDQDIVISCYNSIVWRENLDGLGNFGGNQLISQDYNIISSFKLADINGDGFRNILIASQNEDKLSWLYNTGPLGIQENYDLNLILYPNPTSNSVNIQSESVITSVQLFNQLGQLVYAKDQESGIDKIYLANLSPGVYFAKIKNNLSFRTTKKLIVQ